MHAKHFISAFLLVLALTAAGTYAQTAGAAIVARDEATEGGGAVARTPQGFGASAGTASGSTARGNKSAKAAPKKTAARTTAATTSPAKPKPWNGFIVGDKYTFLNFEVVSAEKPWHTREAKSAGASGLVQVEVLIETNGKVIQAKGRTGNKLLHPEAERAALASTFNRPTFGGKPARAIGFLVYRFGPAED
jgi:hypothetical protein